MKRGRDSESKGNKTEHRGRTKREKKFHKYNRHQVTDGTFSVFYVAMLSSLSSPVLICDYTPDATVLALTGDVGEPVWIGGG